MRHRAASEHTSSLVVVLALVGSFILHRAYAQMPVNFESPDYSNPELNDALQTLPIPGRIHEIIYPTIGFPSLVGRGGTFSIILRVSPEQKQDLQAGPFKTEIELSPRAKYPSYFPVPHGFADHYETYPDFIDHQLKTHNESFHAPDELRQNKMTFIVRPTVAAFEFSGDKLILTARMPDDLPDYYNRAMDLDIFIRTSRGSVIYDVQTHSIGLLATKDHFRFIHFADPQLDDSDFNYEGGAGAAHPDLMTQEFALLQASREMNFIKPDFALMSGDLVGGANPYLSVFYVALDKYLPPDDIHLRDSNYWEEYQSAVSFVRTLDFPVFIAPGNHDGGVAYAMMDSKTWSADIQYSDTFVGKEDQKVLYDGKFYWRRMIGPRYYSFDRGIWHFVILDTYDLRRVFRTGYSWLTWNAGGWMSQEQMAWLETDLRAASAAGQKSVLVGHQDPRGGVNGQHYGDEKFRRIQRRTRPLKEEIDFAADRYREDREAALASEWMSPRTDFPGHENPDGAYDSARELLRLIGAYNVTHVLLGHDHADFTDQVRFGDRTVEFIHTTTVAAVTAQARTRPDYLPEAGQGRGFEKHWGYRTFEAGQDGTMKELFTHDDHRSIELGNLRFDVGHDPQYRSQVAGIFSAGRALPAWVPYGAFLQTLDNRSSLPSPIGGLDPLLLSYGICRPEASAVARQLYPRTDWSPDDKSRMKDLLDGAITQVEDQITGDNLSPHQVLILNQNDVAVDGVLEFPVDWGPSVPITSSRQWVETDPLSAGFGSLEVSPSEPVSLQSLPGGVFDWLSIPLTITSSENRRTYRELNFGASAR